MTTLSVSSQRQSRPKHTNIKEKINQRLWLISNIDNPKILDCFAGDGSMRDRVYQNLDYLGIDINFHRDILFCDSRRYLRNIHVDLNLYDIFDLDAYGSCCEHLWIICNRIKANKKVGFALTQSGVLGQKNNIPPQVLNIADCSSHMGTRFQIKYTLDIYDKFFSKCWEVAGFKNIQKKFFNCPGYMNMLYYAFICQC